MIFATSPSTLYVECTFSHDTDWQTGIQRVVHQFLRYAPALADRAVTPVIWDQARGGFRQLYARTARIWQWLPRQWLAQRAAAMIDFQPGDRLLILDAAWNYDLWPGVAQARTCGAEVSLFCYDLIPLIHTELVVPEMTRLFEIYLRQAIRQVDRILVSSWAVAQELEAYCAADRLPPLCVCPLGVELAELAQQGQVRHEIARFQIPGSPLFLCVGTLCERKGQARLLDASERLWAQGLRFRLALVGRGDPQDPLSARLAAHPRLGSELFHWADANDAELEQLYAVAHAVVLPSLAEGYGLPVVEALSRGRPVIVADLPVFREIAGPWPRYVDPRQPEAIAEAIRDWLPEAPLAHQPPGDLRWPTWRDATTQLLAHLGMGLRA
jgi:alpha-1,2-rhamnosyltransferase